MSRGRGLILLLLLWPGLVWSQGQVIPGNRTVIGTLNAGLTTGTGAAYVLTLSPPLTAYVPEQQFVFRAHTASTGAATLGVNTVGARPLRKWQGTTLVELAAGDIQAGQEVHVVYDGSVMQAISLGGGTSGPGGTASAVGPNGTLQASNGAGNLAQYPGTNCPAAGTFARELTAQGSFVCAGQATGTARALVAQSSAEVPNGVNLGALPSGIVFTTVSGGLATVNTTAMPASAIVGVNDTQSLTNKEVVPRVFAAQNTDTAIQVNLDTMDLITVANLTQGLTIAAPTGSAVPGQAVTFHICSAASQPLTWTSAWSSDAGVALPTSTVGGGACDHLLFHYHAAASHMDLIHNVSALRNVCSGTLPPGSYTNTNLTVNSLGCLSAISTGTGGPGGAATPAGQTGDVQFNRAGQLAADTGGFTYEPLGNYLTAGNLQLSPHRAMYQFRDVTGKRLFVTAKPRLTAHRHIELPDEDGELCVKGGAGCGGGPGGAVDVSGTPTSGQSAEWVDANTLQGVAVIGSGRYVKETSTTLTTPIIAALANLTTNGFVKTGGGTGTLSVDTATYTNVSGTPSTGQAAEWSTANTLQGVAVIGSGRYVKETSPTLTTPTIGALANLSSNGVVTTSGSNGTLGIIAQPTGALVGTTETQTVSNKRLTRRVTSLSSSSTFTCPADTADQCKMAMTGVTGVLTVAAPTGTPVDGDMLLFRLRCTNAQTYSFNAIFLASPNVALPTSCPANTTQETMLGFVYSSDLVRWQLIAVN